MNCAAFSLASVVLSLNVVLALDDTGSRATETKLKRELEAQLPAESRHTFRPVSKVWVKTANYIDPVLLETYSPEKVSEEQKKRFEKEEVHSTTGRKEGDHRVQLFDPAGNLIFIGDWFGEDEFTQTSYANGSIRTYMHRRKGKLREGYSVGPDGKEVHRVARGNGILKHHGDKPNDFGRAAYCEGTQFFQGNYVGGKLDFVRLNGNEGELSRRRGGSEEFFVNQKRTWWGINKDRQVRLKRLDGEFDLKKIAPDRVKLWEGKYAECLAEFLKSYDTFLGRTNYSWAKLDIEFVRERKPFPDE